MVGDYDQCLAIDSSDGGSTKTPFVGQYCFAKPLIPHPHRGQRPTHVYNKFKVPTSLIDEVMDFLHIFNGTIFRFGICLPSTCSAEEIQWNLNKSISIFRKTLS